MKVKRRKKVAETFLVFFPLMKTVRSFSKNNKLKLL